MLGSLSLFLVTVILLVDFLSAAQIVLVLLIEKQKVTILSIDALITRNRNRRRGLYLLLQLV